MLEQEKDLERYYKLSVKELTCPENGKGVTEWFDQLAKRQLEGIDLGICPQNPRGLSPSLREEWLSRVWAAYLEDLSFGIELEIAGVTVAERGERHTSSGRRYYQDEF
jgi:hypothetical protein